MRVSFYFKKFWLWLKRTWHVVGFACTASWLWGIFKDWGQVFSLPSATSALIIYVVGIFSGMPAVDIIMKAIAAAATAAVFVAILLFVFAVVYWIREQQKRKKGDPRKDVRASFFAVTVDELASQRRLAFSLMVSHRLDNDISFMRQEVGHMKYSNESLTRPIKLPSAEVVPSRSDGVIGSYEEKEVLLLQQMPPELALSMAASYESGKQQSFNWLDIRVLFQYRSKEYILRIPQAVYFYRAPGSVPQVGEIKYGTIKMAGSVETSAP
jgi:hypothetical protein